MREKGSSFARRAWFSRSQVGTNLIQFGTSKDRASTRVLRLARLCSAKEVLWGFGPFWKKGFYLPGGFRRAHIRCGQSIHMCVCVCVAFSAQKSSLSLRHLACFQKVNVRNVGKRLVELYLDDEKVCVCVFFVASFSLTFIQLPECFFFDNCLIYWKEWKPTKLNLWIGMWILYFVEFFLSS